MQNSVNMMSHGMSVQLRSSSGFQLCLVCGQMNNTQELSWLQIYCRSKLCNKKKTLLQNKELLP